jgi:hypothetical protein
MEATLPKPGGSPCLTIQNEWVPHIWRSFIAPDVGDRKSQPSVSDFPECLISEKLEVREFPNPLLKPAQNTRKTR